MECSRREDKTKREEWGMLAKKKHTGYREEREKILEHTLREEEEERGGRLPKTKR